MYKGYPRDQQARNTGPTRSQHARNTLEGSFKRAIGEPLPARPESVENLLVVNVEKVCSDPYSRPRSSVLNARITFSSSRSNSAWSFSQPTKLAATRLVISAFLPLW